MDWRPNILFVFTDQHTRGALSAWGNRFLHTPHLDSLARNGVMFWNSYCASPVCGPARASLVTGRMPHETGVEWNGLQLPAHVPTFGEVFRQAGYETAWAGPWHLSEYYPPADSDLRGFRHLGVPRSPLEHLGTHVDETIATRAIEFLHQRHRQPFFLGVSLVNPHDICYWITERNRDVLNRFLPQGDLPPLPDNFAVDPDEPEFIQICRQRDHYGDEQRWTTSWDETMWRTYLAVYYRMVEHADASLGRILAALRERGLEDDTLVVFTSDHGEGVAAHRWVVKLMLYEETAAVPFIIGCKGRIPAGRVDRSHLVSGIDVMPTLCDYADIPAPKGLPGSSLKAVIEEPSAAGRDFVVSELLPDFKRPEWKGRMLRTRRHKYIAFSYGTRPELLFDLENDPGETNNLAGRSGHSIELQRHRDLLAQWIRKANDPFLPDFDCGTPASSLG